MLRSTLIFLTVSVFLGQSAPERKVAGSAVSSTHDPHVQIHLPESAQYVGADRFRRELLAAAEAYDLKIEAIVFWMACAAAPGSGASRTGRPTTM